MHTYTIMACETKDLLISCLFAMGLGVALGKRWNEEQKPVETPIVIDKEASKSASQKTCKENISYESKERGKIFLKPGWVYDEELDRIIQVPIEKSETGIVVNGEENKNETNGDV